MSRLEIQVEGKKDAFAPGERIQGRFSWQLEKSAKAMELRLVWYTSGKGTTDVSVENSERIEAPEMSENREFRFVLPLAPHSFSGTLISLTWALELVVLPGDDSEIYGFVMAPGGREIELEGMGSPDLKNLPDWMRRKIEKRMSDKNSSDAPSDVTSTTPLEPNSITAKDSPFSSSTLKTKR